MVYCNSIIFFAQLLLIFMLLGGALELAMDLEATFPNTLPLAAVFVFDSPLSIWLVFIIHVPGVPSFFAVTVICF